MIMDHLLNKPYVNGVISGEQNCSRTDTLSLCNERTLQPIYYFRRVSADA